MDQHLYSEAELAQAPAVALNLSRGCGNPTGFAAIQSGEVVADFGCGAGLDVILAARKVGPRGRVIGLDFAPEMVARAQEAIAALRSPGGDIELCVADLASTGLPAGGVDVIISNCVINLIPDKTAVYREAFRILKPGGRAAISDIVLTGKIDAALKERFQATWPGCLGGAIPEDEYLNLIREAGFAGLQIVARHLLTPVELAAMACCPGKEFTPPPAPQDLGAVQGKVASIKFRALKPLA